jgi:DeoR/GlpR family transcriptional regulator of sugar metabolism
VRNHHGIPVYSDGERQARGEMSVREVADALGVTPTTIFRLIQLKQLPAIQACVNAPWVMLKSDVEIYSTKREQSNTPPQRDPAQLLFEIQ